MCSRTLILCKTAFVLVALMNSDLLAAQDSIALAEASHEMMIYRDYTERLVRLEETKNFQFLILLLISLAIISYLIYKVYSYRKLLRRYEALKMPQPSRRISPAVVKTEPQPLPLDTEELDLPVCSDQKILDLAAKFEQLMQEEHLYRESFLTRERVAALLETNRTYIGQVMSEVFHESFSQYINDLRINEAISILDNPASKRPIRLIGRDLGFNSVTTFNAQFQKRTGMTPAQYRLSVIESQKE